MSAGTASHDLLVNPPDVLLGGWSYGTGLLKQAFPHIRHILDPNRIMPRIIVNDTLTAHWKEQLAEWFTTAVGGTPVTHIAGWSLGALCALAIAQVSGLDTCTCLAGTLSFCRNAVVRAGTRPLLLRGMRTHLHRDLPGTLTAFHHQCSLPGPHPDTGLHPAHHLDAGLVFLRECSIDTEERMPAHLRFLHGREDRIIAPDAARQSATRAGAPLDLFPGGHAFFVN